MKRFRFLIKDYDGFCHSIERVALSVDDAIVSAKVMTTDVNFVESVTLYEMLSSNSCGPIRYIGIYRYGD